jgi:hypothetical protein
MVSGRRECLVDGTSLARAKGPEAGRNLEQVGELGDEPPANVSSTR